jgi:Domain of unknown function (DUF4145)
MARKRSTNTSIRKGVPVANEPDDPASNLSNSLRELHGFAATAAKNHFKLGGHKHYAAKAHSSLVDIRRSFLELRTRYPKDRFPAVADQLDGLEGPLGQIEHGLDVDPRDLEKAIRDVSYRLGSDLHAAIRSAGDQAVAAGTPFITPDVLKPGVYRKVLEEANRCYDQNCPNACAAMLRRLTESLIIEAFEAHQIEATIKDAAGEYIELKALIGKATAEPALKLSRNTRNALPNLKILGDLSSHSRRHLVRHDDLNGLQKDARIAVEELAAHLP